VNGTLRNAIVLGVIAAADAVAHPAVTKAPLPFTPFPPFTPVAPV
jgi:hypothetical protein